MKTLFFSIVTLGIVTAGSCLVKTEPASAYCVYNKSDDPITALQLTVKPDFEKVINPHPKECCHWTDGSCTEKNDGLFVIYEHPEVVNESEQNYHATSRKRRKKRLETPYSPHSSYANK